MIGHRGAAREAPENTLAAFELAAAQGADGIEFDVHLSADGVPVVIHDARLERTTSGAGRVREFTLATLKRLDAGSWFNRKYPAQARSRFAGTKIPTLAEVLAWAKHRKLLTFVEIKRVRGGYPGIEEKVLAEIERVGARPLATVISFHIPTLRRLRQLDFRIPLGIDFTRPLLAIRRARALGAASVLPHWAFAPPRFIERAHRAGIRVIVWDLDQPLWMRRKISQDVDGIITRLPGKLVEVRSASGSSRP